MGQITVSCRRYHLGTTPPPTTTPAPIPRGCYDPTLAQPLTDGCVFWLGSVDTGGVVSFENRITGAPLVAPVPWAQQTATTMDHPDPEYGGMQVFDLAGPDQSGGVLSNIVLDDSSAWTLTMMYRNTVFDSSSGEEYLFGGGDAWADGGQIALHHDDALDNIFSQDDPQASQTISEFLFVPDTWRRVSVTSNGAGFKNFFVEEASNGISGSILSAEMMIFNQLTDSLGGANKGYLGLAADVRIYNRQLSDVELECLGSKGGEGGEG